jgi:CheY-like chemotaxis protein
MVAIGELSGGIAHDFNNLLGIIIGNLDLLERSVTGNEDIIKRVATALKAATRGADLTKRLLAFSRQQPLTPKSENLNDSVNNLIEMAKQILGKDIKIETELETSLPLILVDIAELESALLNLIVNARDAMPNGGKVIISTKLRELDDIYPSVQTKELPAGLYVALSVTDTGHGIPPEILERVYEPFFTTKERGKGTGMGLSMVYGFAKQSGGTVKIYSEVNHGTTVTLYLSLANNIQPANKEIVQTQQALTHTKVLVVDDELDLLEIAATYLREKGYEVYQAVDGMSAIELFKQIPDITLLLTDVVMPGGMNGVELANKIRQLKPDIVIIFVSGFPLSKLTDNESTKIDGHFLSKPYQQDELISAIQRAMHNHN